MPRELYRYQVNDNVSFSEIESTFVLAVFAAEALHGEVATRLQLMHAMDADRRTVVIDVSTAVGADVNKLFLNYLRKEFGEDSFHVTRLAPDHTSSEVVGTLNGASG